MKIKICGLTSFDAVRSAVKSGADYIGFIFYPRSPRHLAPHIATGLGRHIPDNIKKVAVMVDPTDDDIDLLFRGFMPDLIQCHGNETVARIKAIKTKYKLPIIKAIKVKSSDDVAKGNAYAEVADMLLFDAKAPSKALPGGNGISFDWTLLKMREFDVPWFLSGGLNIGNVIEAIETTGVRALDASSSLESEPGKKDPELIKLFIEKIRNYEKQTSEQQ